MIRERENMNGLAMDAVLDFILEIYRAAQDTVAEEFQMLALGMLQAALPSSRQEWQDLPTQQDVRTVIALMPHLSEALAISRALAAQQVEPAPSAAPGGTRALAHVSGIAIHVGNRFAEMLREQWPDWQSSHLPQELLQAVMRDGQITIANSAINVGAVSLGNLLFLSARRTLPLSRLSIRELAVVRLFGAGKSHKEIARKLELSPVTIRNHIQRAYRKLDIDNKAALARLLEAEEMPNLRKPMRAPGAHH